MPANSFLDSSTQYTLQTPAGNFQVWDQSTGEERGQGAVRESFSREWLETHCVMRLLAPWTQRFQICRAMLGGAQLIGGRPVYTLPMGYPGDTNLSCNKIEISGMGVPFFDTSLPNGGMIGFDYARMDCIFSAPPWQPGTQLAGELQLQFASNAIALDPNVSGFKFTGSGNNAPVPALRVTTTIARLTLFQRPQLNGPLIQSLVDHVNQSSFEGYAASTVLFRGGETNRRLMIDGTLSYDLSLLFEVCSSVQGSWNNGFDASTGTWAAMQAVGSGNPPFASADFTPLLV